MIYDEITTQLFDRIRGIYFNNPAVQMSLSDKSDTIYVSRLISMENRTHIIATKIREIGFSTVTRLEPAFIVPKESIGDVQRYFNKMNGKFIRGSMSIDDNGEVRFNSFIPYSKDNTISDRSLAEELFLGDVVLMNTIQDILKVIDGEDVDEVEKEEKNVKAGGGTGGPEEEPYVPSTNVKDKVGAMYG